jgi:membrane protein
MEQARGFFRKIINQIKKPEMRILPGQLAFFLVMSLIPMIALIGTFAASLSISKGTIAVSITNMMPKEIANILSDMVSGNGLNFNMAIFFISAFILASNGTHSMIITSNEIYRIESKDFISRRIKAIFMIFLLVLVFFFLLIIPVFGDYLINMLVETYKNSTIVDVSYVVYKVLKYPLIALILLFNIKLIYVIAPDEQIPSRSTTSGAIFTTIGWIIATEIYAFYVGTFASYGVFYGSISNVLILLMWIYILAYIFVLGMGINAGTYKEETIQMQRIIEEEHNEKKTSKK